MQHASAGVFGKAVDKGKALARTAQGTDVDTPVKMLADEHVSAVVTALMAASLSRAAAKDNSDLQARPDATCERNTRVNRGLGVQVMGPAPLSERMASAVKEYKPIEVRLWPLNELVAFHYPNFVAELLR